MSSGQGIGAVGGAIIGFVTGGPMGALKGAYWGYMAGSIVDPPPGPHTEGPRLNDRVVQTSEEGAPLPTVYGTARLAGNVIWSSGLEEIAITEEQGGGSGGGGATSTTYTYKTDAAIAICAGEITGVRRIWADAKLIYDISETVDLNTLLASNARAAGIRVYTGSETQLPDPLIQATEVAANTPAFRGMAYVVFEDLQLADYGNRLPNFSFEVVKSGTPQSLNKISEENFIFTDGLGNYTNAPYADSSGLYVWQADYGLRLSTTGYLRLYVIPWGGEPALLKTLLITIPDAIGSSSTYVPKGESDINVFAFSVTTGGYGIALVNENNDIDIYRPNWLSSSLYIRYTIKNNILYITSGFGGSFTIGYVNLINGDEGEITLPFSAAGVPVCLVSTDTHLYLLLDTRICRWDLATLTLTHNIASTDIDTHIGNSFSGLTGDEIIWVTNSTNKIRKTTGLSATYEELAGNLTDSWTNSSPTNYHWHAYQLADEKIYGIWLSYFDITYKLGTWSYGVLSKSTMTLSDVVENVFANTLTAAEYEVTELASDVVRGYTLSRPITGRSALEPLQTAYHFDLSERDGKIYAIKRGGASVITLAEDDLGAAETPDGTKVKLTRHNETELPSEIQISYSDIDNDHQAGTQYARSLTAQATNIQQISLPLAMTATEAAQLADIILNASRYTGRHTLEFSLSYEYARLAPADVVTLPAYGVQWTARIGQVDMGMPGLVQCTASPEIAALYASIVTGGDPTGIGQTIGLTGTTALTLLDCCMLRDTDTTLGWYAALTGSVDTWPGGAAFKSSDSGATWTLAASATRTQSARVGSATTVLPNADCRVWDKTSRLNVRLTADATLSSATETAVLNGANAALIGAHGRWELIQWLTATLEIDGTYTLSDLLRGRKGTEHAAASHAIGDAFVVPEESTLRQIAVSTSELNAARQYKAITTGQLIESVDAVSATYTGERLKPLAPVLFTAAMQPSKNVNLKWQRRDRVARAWASAGNLPQSEDAESYEIDVVIDGAVVRTLTSSTTSLTYTSAEVAADTLGLAETATFNLYQISASLGRGHVAAQSLVLPGYTITPQISTITLGGTFVVGEKWSAVLAPDSESTLMNGVRTATVGDATLSGVATAWASAMTTALLPAFSGLTTIGAVGQVITVTADYPFTLSAFTGLGSISTYLLQSPSNPVSGSIENYYISGGAGTWGPSNLVGVQFTVALRSTISGAAWHSVTATGTSGEGMMGMYSPLLAALQADATFAGMGLAFSASIASGSLDEISYIKISATSAGAYLYELQAYSNDPTHGLISGTLNIGQNPIPAAIPQISGARIYPITPTTGSLFSLTLNSTSFTYTTAPGDDQADIGAGLVTLINAGAEPITAAGAVAGTAYDITLTGDVANTAFTLAGTSSAGGTLAIATTQDYALS